MWYSSIQAWLADARTRTRPARPAAPPSRRQRAACQLNLELLEDRCVPATFTVTNLNDSGAGSLREAIANANADGIADAIVFQAGVTGTLTLTTGQLNVTRPVTITGPGSGALTVSGNNASRIFLVDNGSTAIQNFTISGMTLTQGLATGSTFGGGIQVASEELTLDDVVITANTAVRGGGIDLAANGRLTLVNSRVSGNNATGNNGGGLFLDASSITLIRNSTIASNQTALSGGGISLQGNAFLVVESSTIAGNQTPFVGGGILAQTTSTLFVRNSTISGNTAAGSAGGGIRTGGDVSLTIENSTISTNSTAGDGGGIAALGDDRITIRNSTIAFNTANSDNAGGNRGGGIFVQEPPGPALTLQSTLVAENFVGTPGTREDIFGTVVATSRLNFVGVDTGLAGITNGTNGNQIGTAGTPLNPMLGPLANNGASRQTHALLAGSTAIDAGFNFAGQATDQRGGRFARTFGIATDIGAFEVQPDPPPAPPALPVVEIKVKLVRLRTRVDVLLNGVLRRRFFPFGAFTGAVQVQRVDVNGDGLLDVRARARLNGKTVTRTFLT